eukprot:4932945-Pyramimonas_sp.AAC.2
MLLGRSPLHPVRQAEPGSPRAYACEARPWPGKELPGMLESTLQALRCIHWIYSSPGVDGQNSLRHQFDSRHSSTVDNILIYRSSYRISNIPSNIRRTYLTNSRLNGCPTVDSGAAYFGSIDPRMHVYIWNEMGTRARYGHGRVP